jgi:hypothetical protein
MIIKHKILYYFKIIGLDFSLRKLMDGDTNDLMAISHQNINL